MKVAFFRLFIACVGLFAALYLTVAVVVNPRGIFKTKFFPAITLDSRRQKMDLFNPYLKGKPIEGIVLGSSRSMKLDPRDLQSSFGKCFFNFAVENAHAEDYAAIYRWVKQQGVRPSVVIIGLDIEALHSDNMFDNQLKRNVALMSLLQEGPSVRLFGGGSTAQFVEDTKTCFTLSFTMDIFRALMVSSSRRKLPPVMHLQYDGYLNYLRYDAQRKLGEFSLDKEIELSIEEYRRRFKNMEGVSPLREKYLEEMISEIEKDGATAIVWITNLHPSLTRNLAQTSKYPQLLDGTRRVLIKLHERHANLRYFDCSDPARYGGDEFDWYDGAHIGGKNARKLVRLLASGMRKDGF